MVVGQISNGGIMNWAKRIAAASKNPPRMQPTGPKPPPKMTQEQKDKLWKLAQKAVKAGALYTPFIPKKSK